MVHNIQQIQQGQQRMDLLNKNMETQANALMEKRRQTDANNYFKLATVKGQTRENRQVYLNKFADTLGYPRMTVDEDGKLIERLKGIQSAFEKDPTGRYDPLIQDVINEFGDDEHKLKQIGLLGKNIQEEKQKAAGQFMSLLQASGGVARGQQDMLLRSFSETAGVPELRTEAAARLKQRKELQPTADKEFTQTLDLMGKDDKVHSFQYNPDTNRYDIDAGLAKPSASGGRSGFLNESSLRKEFNSHQAVKEFRDVSGKFNNMEAALSEAGSQPKSFVAVDQALITMFNKMLDPQSVVRESEYARTAEDISLLNRLRGKIDKLTEGGAGLTPVERDAIIRMGRNFFDISKFRYQETSDFYREIADRGGIDPNLIIQPSGEPREKEKSSASTEERIPPHPKRGPEISDSPKTAEEFLKKFGK